MRNFDSIIDEGIYIGYYSTRKAYRHYNQRLKKILESQNVKVEEIRSKRINWYEQLEQLGCRNEEEENMEGNEEE